VCGGKGSSHRGQTLTAGWSLLVVSHYGVNEYAHRIVTVCIKAALRNLPKEKFIAE
jgi:hypothetical protein